MVLLTLVCLIVVIHNWTHHYITVHWDVRSQAVTDTASSVL